MFKASAINYSDVGDMCFALWYSFSLGKKNNHLGHWVTDDVKDNTDIERERRSLAV